MLEDEQEMDMRKLKAKEGGIEIESNIKLLRMALKIPVLKNIS